MREAEAVKKTRHLSFAVVAFSTVLCLPLLISLALIPVYSSPATFGEDVTLTAIGDTTEANAPSSEKISASTTVWPSILLPELEEVDVSALPMPLFFSHDIDEARLRRCVALLGGEDHEVILSTDTKTDSAVAFVDVPPMIELQLQGDVAVLGAYRMGPQGTDLGWQDRTASDNSRKLGREDFIRSYATLMGMCSRIDRSGISSPQ